MKTIAASLLALGLFAGVAQAADAPKSIFDQINETAPRSVFDDIRDTAPRTVFDDLQESAPRSDGVFGQVDTRAP